MHILAEEFQKTIFSSTLGNEELARKANRDLWRKVWHRWFRQATGIK
jgi:hypothetical protein